MLDLRPVGYVIGLLVAILGGTMVFPLLLDLYDGKGEWPVFLESALFCLLVGVILLAYMYKLAWEISFWYLFNFLSLIFTMYVNR